MGDLDQFAKSTFALDTEEITGGAIAWEGTKEVGLTEVRLDGLLSVLAPDRVGHLPAPWNDAARHADVVVEIKMPGDHLDLLAIRRAELRRVAWHVRRLEQEGSQWENSVGLWVVAPHVPEVLRRLFSLHEKAPGCYAVATPEAGFWWIAANELPLDEALVPFLIARSGPRLVELARWALGRRADTWVTSMLTFLPMNIEVSTELLEQLHATRGHPALRAQRTLLARKLLEDLPELREEVARAGTLNEAKKNLRRVLARRGLALSPAQEAQIDACADLATMERWLDQAITAGSADEALL